MLPRPTGRPVTDGISPSRFHSPRPAHSPSATPAPPGPHLPPRSEPRCRPRRLPRHRRRQTWPWRCLPLTGPEAAAPASPGVGGRRSAPTAPLGSALIAALLAAPVPAPHRRDRSGLVAEPPTRPHRLPAALKLEARWPRRPGLAPRLRRKKRKPPSRAQPSRAAAAAAAASSSGGRRSQPGPSPGARGRPRSSERPDATGTRGASLSSQSAKAGRSGLPSRRRGGRRCLKGRL